MNLYKIQEELKFKSIPELQHFANGMDPKVPAWMASAVLKAKVDEKQRWDNMQGAAQGQMPSIKEQLEQKAGLMQQQASQAPAGLAQAAMPAPKGPVQMPGGITSGNAGANMNFAEGGIVGFSDGGATKRIRYTNEGENLLPATTGYEGMDLWDAIKAMGGDFKDYLAATEKAALQGPTTTRTVPATYNPNVAKEDVSVVSGVNGPSFDFKAGEVLPTAGNSVYTKNEKGETVLTTRPVGMSDADWASLVKGLGGLGMAPTGNVAGSRRTPQQLAAAGINPTVAPAGGLGGATRTPPAGAPAAPGAAPGAVPAAGGLGSSSVAGMLQKQLGKEAAQPTTEDAIAAIKGIQKGFGVDTPAGKEEREMIAQMRAQREGQIKDRGMQNLITYLTNVRGSTIGEGLGRGAQMSQAEIARQNAADLANQEKMYEMVSALNKANRAEGVGAAKSAGELLAGREKTAGEADRARLQALANVYHSDVAAGAQVQSARIMAAAREAGLDSKEIQMAESAYARDPEANSIREQMKLPQIANNPQKMEEKVKRLQEIQISKYAQFGLKIEGTTPGAGAGGTPPPGAVRLKQ